MKTTRKHDTREADAPAYCTTTLYDLMTALQTVVEPSDDTRVVTLVTRWLQTVRITLLGKAAARRRLRCKATMALCRWGFHPPMIHTPSLASANHRLQGLKVHAAPPGALACTLETMPDPPQPAYKRTPAAMDTHARA